MTTRARQATSGKAIRRGAGVMAATRDLKDRKGRSVKGGGGGSTGKVQFQDFQFAKRCD